MLVEEVVKKSSKREVEFSLKVNNSWLDKIAVYTCKGFQLIKIENILRFEARGKNTLCVLVSGEQILSNKVLKTYDDLLGKYNFVRVHHSHLINLSYIKTYQKGRLPKLLMVNNETIDVSQRKKKELVERIKLMLSYEI